MPSFRLPFIFFAMFSVSLVCAFRPWSSLIAYFLAALLLPIAFGFYVHIVEQKSRQDSSLVTFVVAMLTIVSLQGLSQVYELLETDSSRISTDYVTQMVLNSLIIGVALGAFLGLFSVLLFRMLLWITPSTRADDGDKDAEAEI